METIKLLLIFLIALSCAITSFILILPEKRRSSLNGFFKVVADILNFRELLLEKILKFMYIFSTVYVILSGFFILVNGGDRGLIVGFGLMIAGPIAIRIFYELIMMFVILVKNTNDINRKMVIGKESKKETECSEVKCSVEDNYTPMVAEEPTPVAGEIPAETEGKICPNCNTAAKSKNSAFCQKCGYKF